MLLLIVKGLHPPENYSKKLEIYLLDKVLWRLNCAGVNVWNFTINHGDAKGNNTNLTLLFDRSIVGRF